jgi:2Fe-2S ferredoxin
MVAPASGPPSDGTPIDKPRQVVVEPGGARFDVRPKESVIQAAWRSGYQWPTTCWGQAECGVCAMEVLEGSELLCAAEPKEAARLRSLPRRQSAGRRLACQARFALDGTITVRKPGVRTR